MSMGEKRSWRRKLLAVCLIALIALPFVLFMPFLFIGTLWDVCFLRHRMAWDVRQRVVGLHEDEIIQLLGEPYTFANMIYYRLRCSSHMWFWQSLVIQFDDARIAIETISHVNPYHIT